MFFSKVLTPQKNPNPKKISILGDSALSLTIANDLQNIGHTVKIICSPQLSDEYNATDFIFKDSHFLQHHQAKFFFSFEQNDVSDLLIIASDITSLRNDLLLISTAKLQNSLILNLTPYSPQTMLKEILESAPIEARNLSLLWKHKNTISNSDLGVTLYLPSDTKDIHVNILQEIFKNSKINIELSDSFDSCHWEWIAIRVLFLLCLCLKQHPQLLYKNDSIRLQTDNCLKEISHIANLKSQTIDTNKVINILQNTPNNLNTPIPQDSKSFNIYTERLFNIIFQGVALDEKRFPTLKMIFNNI
ncbi:MAG: hypothetical protein E7019_00375 [Alphaproteobacteria bacterium]|nr:hypothetical protein [Alphaproteobacteria bacterium]